jgi:hypothetical protein
MISDLSTDDDHCGVAGVSRWSDTPMTLTPLTANTQPRRPNIDY